VTFRTIFPGWYMGRATYIHAQAFIEGAVIKTTQAEYHAK
jgi:hypothetical protein